MAQNEKVKRYLVVGLAVVAMLVAYLRFFKPKQDQAVVTSAPVEVMRAPVPKAVAHKIEPRKEIPQQISRQPQEKKRLFLVTDMRDIFELPPIPPELKEKTMASGRVKTPAMEVIPDDIPLRLRGTIIGGSRPMAIINEKFVKLGEKIDIFEVIRIEANEVVLKAGSHERILKVLKPDELLKQ